MLGPSNVTRRSFPPVGGASGHETRERSVTLLAFLGCADSAMRACIYQYVFVGGRHMTAESAQPRKARNVTRHFPFPFLGGVWGRDYNTHGLDYSDCQLLEDKKN